MPSTIPVSAVLITKDAERHLDRVLEPLSVCSEIVVLDSGSTDRTREIARAHGARLYDGGFIGYGPQKRRAVELARHDWILSVDGDEVLDQDAVDGLRAVDWPAADLIGCWRIRRRTFIGEREIRYGHWSTDRPVRVFNRLVTGVSPDIVHESVQPTSRVLDLPGSMLHYSYADLSEVIRLDFHRLKAVKYRRAARRASAPLLAVRGIWAALHSYVLRRGCLEGGFGVVIALAAAVNATMGLALASETDAVGTAGEGKRRLRPVEEPNLPKSA
jgi:glycosyltransferase involved in cell wall biosynthesis